jgi:hypothetical protein
MKIKICVLSIVLADENGPAMPAVFADETEARAKYDEVIGFVYGTEQLSYSDIGARARLLAVIPTYRSFSWMPYVGMTVDRRLGVNHTFDIPNQAAAIADTLNFAQSNTFWGVEGGLDTLFRGSARFGIKTFYQTSADTQIIGGNVFLKIPLWEPALAAQDSGIRIARSK